MNWHRRRPSRGRGITLLVPFKSDGGRREDNWQWLQRFWREHLPEAQLIMGSDERCDPDGGVAFSKAAAVNDAARHATGDVVVILDADCYIRPQVILDCAEDIREHRRVGHKIWFMPYRRFWRLTEDFSDVILRSDPEHSVWPPNPPAEWMVQEVAEKSSSCGHWFGALIQVMPREAFDAAGGMDERFRDWGGEDVSFMRAVDALYARHRTTNNPVYHLWHPTFGSTSPERHWSGGSSRSNDWLSDRYTQRIGDPLRMKHLVDEPKDV